jgi:transposase
MQQAIEEKSRQEAWWHADETTWRVFQMPEGKRSHRWYLWVFVSPSAVVYILDPGRSAQVVQKHLGEVEQGTLCVDRYSAYKKFAKDKGGIVLAFCWTHQRRDFLKVGGSWPDLEDWAMEWVQRIGKVFHLNHQRLSHPRDSEGFLQADRQLRKALGEMEQVRDEELHRQRMDAECLAVLNSLKKHWEGLTVFLDQPHIPMDNSEAERRMRGPALGRKNYYGSVCIWSGHFTATLFGIFQTLLKWSINPRAWLNQYLTLCAKNGGRPPQDIRAFLPWEMPEEDRRRLKLPRIRGDPPR